MCGIFGMIASEDIAPLVLRGLARLEYRGYDSCGLAVLAGDGDLVVRKGAGEVAQVTREEHLESLHGSVALGHTRWATHGRVSKTNAHPHYSHTRDVAIVHNGILENHNTLRRELEAAGYQFRSETDSEVVAQLIEREFDSTDNLEEAILRTLRRLEGTYGLGVISRHEPDAIYAARNESPLIVGVGKGANGFASDTLAFGEFTQNVVVLEDGEFARITRESVEFRSIDTGEELERTPTHIDLESRDTDLHGFDDYMSKEIHENCEVTRTALNIGADLVDDVAGMIEAAKTTYLTGIGTSYYVAVMAQYAFRRLTGEYLPAISCDELPYLARFDKSTAVLAISQSGETYDTLKALRLAQKGGSRTAAILNVATSSMAREVDHVIVQRAGAEICVLSTKSTVSQLVLMFRVALRLGERNGYLSAAEVAGYQAELDRLPEGFERIWETSHEVLRDLARPLSVIRNWFFIGRSIYHGLALEAALKFKEVTYCHAEGMPAGALKHGTISLIDETMYSAIFLPSSAEEELRTSSLGAVAEITARKGRVVAFQPEGHGDPDGLFYKLVEYPDHGPLTNPLLALMQAQLFAYYTAKALGRNVDKPRNLAKSVTVG